MAKQIRTINDLAEMLGIDPDECPDDAALRAHRRAARMHAAHGGDWGAWSLHWRTQAGRWCLFLADELTRISKAGHETARYKQLAAGYRARARRLAA